MSSKPKPIRLTRARAIALLDAAERGVEEWRREITGNLQTSDLETMRRAKQLDTDRAAALDAMAIVRARYLGGDEPTDSTPTLFDRSTP